MISYTMVGTRDLKAAIAFYDPLFDAMGLDVCWRDQSSTSWGRADDERFPRFFVGYPFNGDPASAGNGTMTAFWADAPSTVDHLYRLAMAAGGSCEGKPGPRPQYGEAFYGAYGRDPDGNKIAFVHF